jgi:prophage regulatory protein
MSTDTFLRIDDVMRLTGFSRSSLYRLVGLGQFPQGIKLSERAIAWSSSEIEKWQRERITLRDKSEV